MVETESEALQSAGLTVNETKVYLSLIKLGSTGTDELIKLSGIHRRPVYDALNRLLEKGLVSFTINDGIKHFQPAPPEKIIDLLKEKEESFNKFLPQLSANYSSKKPHIFTTSYEGVGGLKSLLLDVLKTDSKELLSIGSTGVSLKLIPIPMAQFHKKRIEMNITRKVLLADTVAGKKYYDVLKKQPLTEIKFLPKEINSPQTTWVYGNKIAIVLASEKLPFCSIIENEDIAKGYRGYFNMLWKQAKTIKENKN